MATPAIVYTTALFSDAHVDRRSQRGSDDASEEREEVPSFVLDPGIGTGWEDMMLVVGYKDRTARLYLDSFHIEKIGNAIKYPIHSPKIRNGRVRSFDELV